MNIFRGGLQSPRGGFQECPPKNKGLNYSTVIKAKNLQLQLRFKSRTKIKNTTNIDLYRAHNDPSLQQIPGLQMFSEL